MGGGEERSPKWLSSNKERLSFYAYIRIIIFYSVATSNKVFSAKPIAGTNIMNHKK